MIAPATGAGDAGGGPGSSPFDAHRCDYDEVLNRGLAVSGENAAHFARRRIEWLGACLRRLGERPASVLDYGCGHGSSAPLFLEILGVSRVLGVEKSSGLLEAARARIVNERIRFAARDGHVPDGSFDLAFCNGVFHHVPPGERAEEVRFLRRSLKPGGLLAFWENNAWNPGTRLVMSRIPFDRGSRPLAAVEAKRMLRAGGLSVIRTDHLFLFPGFLRALRPLEPLLTALPAGAQYQVLCRAPA
ncbi:MAG: class I SAM-dependent methyltransferase [Thermoanaerobaculia bacterium]